MGTQLAVLMTTMKSGAGWPILWKTHDRILAAPKAALIDASDRSVYIRHALAAVSTIVEQRPTRGSQQWWIEEWLYTLSNVSLGKASTMEEIASIPQGPSCSFRYCHIFLWFTVGYTRLNYYLIETALLSEMVPAWPRICTVPGDVHHSGELRRPTHPVSVFNVEERFARYEGAANGALRFEDHICLGSDSHFSYIYRYGFAKRIDNRQAIIACDSFKDYWAFHGSYQLLEVLVSLPSVRQL